MSRLRHWLASLFTDQQAQNTELELKRLDLELMRERVKELELECQLEGLQADTARAFCEMNTEPEPEPQQAFVYQSDYPPPDFDRFYVLIDQKDASAHGDENEIFAVTTCSWSGVVGEQWFRSTEERALGLASWIVKNHERCDGMISRIGTIKH